MTFYRTTYSWTVGQCHLYVSSEKYHTSKRKPKDSCDEINVSPHSLEASRVAPKIQQHPLPYRLIIICVTCFHIPTEPPTTPWSPLGRRFDAVWCSLMVKRISHWKWLASYPGYYVHTSISLTRSIAIGLPSYNQNRVSARNLWRNLVPKARWSS